MKKNVRTEITSRHGFRLHSAVLAVVFSLSLLSLGCPSLHLTHKRDKQTENRVPAAAPAADPQEPMVAKDSSSPQVPAATPAVPSSNSGASAGTAAPSPSKVPRPPKPLLGPPVVPFGGIPTPITMTGQPTDDDKKLCEASFPARSQEASRKSCAMGSATHRSIGKLTAQSQCRSAFSTDMHGKMACLIGTLIQEKAGIGNGAHRERARLCRDHFPAHSEIDVYLQESCLTGIWLPELTGQKPAVSQCSQLSIEGSFVGPCTVGLTLSNDLRQTDTTADSIDKGLQQQNRLCTQFFDNKAFHTGYRACLNARGLALTWTGKYKDVVKDCKSLVANPKSDTERAACLVGASIHQNLSSSKAVSPRFANCGENKVSYQDRDYLTCLTAASLMDFLGKKEAQGACKELFTGRKSTNRNECLRSLDLF